MVPISVVLFPCICSSALVIASLPVLTVLVVVTVGAGISLQTAKNVVVYFIQFNDTAQIVTYKLQLLH